MKRFFIPLVCLAASFATGCGPAPESSPSAEAVPPATSAPALPDLSRFDSKVDELLGQMTLAEKVGQMTQADMSYIEDEADVSKYFLGSVLSGGGSDPSPENTFADWRDMVGRFHQRAAETRLGIPLLYGVDAVHGHSNVVGAVVFPHNVGLGATRDATLVEAISRVTAKEVRATGINWNFAPCVAVARDPRWGRTYESFGEDPELVTELGAAAVRGLVGSGYDDPSGVLACAKHFAGDGGTAFGTGSPKEAVPDSVFAESGRSESTETEIDRWPLDRGDTVLDEATFRELHITPYLPALEAGSLSVMASFSSWNGEKVSGHRRLLTEILKEEIGFTGFLVSDWAAIDDLPGDYKSDIATSINAGLDMIMVPDRYQEFITLLTELVEEGTVPMERIDDAVRRILRVKHAMGLFEPSAESPDLESSFGSAEHRSLARRAVRQSLVLLKNEGSALPLAKDLGHVHVVGKNADDLGNQCGGWTIAWQGASGPITEGTTVLEAIRQAVGTETKVTYGAPDDPAAEGADVMIAVIGETPYSEMMGDRTSLDLDSEDQETVRAAASSGAPVVTVLISGRPMVLGETFEQSAAVVAAWLPGTEGQGVTDVLFGDHAPTGKLAFTWPRSTDQLPLAGVEDADPQFPYGFGLGY